MLQGELQEESPQEMGVVHRDLGVKPLPYCMYHVENNTRS